MGLFEKFKKTIKKKQIMKKKFKCQQCNKVLEKNICTKIIYVWTVITFLKLTKKYSRDYKINVNVLGRIQS